MGNSRYYQFLFSKVPMLSVIETDLVVGSSGAVSSISGAGLNSITRLTTGIYQYQFSEDYNHFVGASVLKESGITGSPVADGSFVTNTLYQITVVGTTNWYSVGLNSGLTPAIGQLFVATGAGGAGTGTATAIGNSGVVSVEVAQNPQVSLAPGSLSPLGALVIAQTLNSSNALVNPTSGARIRIMFYFRNSSNAF